jgi:N-methylhydantoinase A
MDRLIKIRIGIDVGGTFTDAVAINNDTFELIKQVKVPTTHNASRGVAEGVIRALRTILDSPDFSAEDVVFIAHGTTQATNALLEGDVVKVGILGMSSGLDGLRARGQARVEDIELSQGHVLHTTYEYMDTSHPPNDEDIRDRLQKLANDGAMAFVASESYSVDDPRNENRVIDVARKMELPVCSTHQISKRYGLKIRTRTAVINASILPKMVQTANMTESSVTEAGITAPLLIMRGDGGAMTIGEMRKRPIMTLLSGPAAGVAGALMYARVSDGIFLEVGGTSTDISAIRNGQVLVDYATVGGHSTYLPSLDVRTIGIAGGSMIRLRQGQLAEVGPRSAHIAGLRYAAYADPDEIVDPQLIVFQPVEEDPEEYLAVKTRENEIFALTLSGAANIAGMVSGGEYAAGNIRAAQRAFRPLADRLGVSVDELANLVLEKAIEKILPPVQELMRKYDLNETNTVLVGGGGGAATVVPYLSKKTGLRSEIAASAEVISTIGVALAMVREMVERTISKPTKEDILRIRKEAEDAVLDMGAVPESIEVVIEIDKQMNLVRAIASGALEMRSKDLSAREVSPELRRQSAAKSMEVDPMEVQLEVSTDNLEVYISKHEEKHLFGLFTDLKIHGRVVDKDGVVRLKLANTLIYKSTPQELEYDLHRLIDRESSYKDSGQLLPNVFVVYGSRIINISGLASSDQMIAVAKEEIAGVPTNTKLILIADKR